MEFRLLTLGGLRLDAGGAPVSGAPAQRRRLALLALLASAGDRGLSREKAFGYLWPEHETARARHQLSESIYVLKRLLGESAILATLDDLRLDSTQVWSDVSVFRAALAKANRELAVSVYAGRFLDGFFLDNAPEFDQWATNEREALDREFVRTLEALAEQQSEPTAALPWWERLAAHEPLNSRIALRYMEVLAQAGERARALQHAATHAARLRDELGVAPDEAVTKLAAKLQRSDAASRNVTRSSDQPFADFEVVRVLGEGSVARVYLARELALMRMVAIKVLLPQHAQAETARIRFEREAHAAARIQHPNVATAFRFGRMEDGTPFLVMPYVAGGSLADRLAGGPLPMAEAKRHIAQIASALAAAHRLGIVHRDVRPANVLYDRDSDRVLLADFGIAAVLEDGSAASVRLTRPGEALGDVKYASPEQLRGESVTQRADVYSLGVMAFEMLTGRLPFEGTKPAHLLAAHVTAEPLRLRELLPDADRKLEALLGRCLQKRPEQRPYADEITAAVG
jgi:DNA-binding SARP family transcriptional activator/tRNA A-37 threonylcarbamoyl transferase component Bud32